MLSNHLVRFNKPIYVSLFANSPHSSNEKILAQDVVQTIIVGDMNDCEFENSVISKDDPDSKSDSEGTQEYANKNNSNYYTLL